MSNVIDPWNLPEVEITQEMLDRGLARLAACTYGEDMRSILYEVYAAMAFEAIRQGKYRPAEPSLPRRR
jgi:hypothetical protein